jgi:hypothetical protein
VSEEAEGRKKEEADTDGATAKFQDMHSPYFPYRQCANKWV